MLSFLRRNRRAAAALAIGIFAGTLLVSPASAHVGETATHLWAKHIKPLALEIFFTKSQVRDNYFDESESDSRFAKKATLKNSGTINASANPVAWSKLKGVPSALARKTYADSWCQLAAQKPYSYPSAWCGPLTTTVDSSNDVGAFSSIAAGADGLPIIAYHDKTDLDLRVTHCGNAACSAGNVSISVDTSGYVGEYSSIVIGADGLPVISYRDTGNGVLKVLHCGTPDCTSGNDSTVVDSETGSGAYSDIAIGADGFPVIAHQDNGARLRVSHCGNVTCTSGNVSTTVDSIDEDHNVGLFNSIAIGADGLAVISHRSVVGDSATLRLTHCGNVTCTSGNISGSIESSGDPGAYSSIAIGTDGLATVSTVSGQSSVLMVMRCIDAACTTNFGINPFRLADSSGDVGKYSSIAIGADGYPIISHRDTTRGGLRVTHCGNSSCSAGNTSGTTDTGNDSGHYTSIAIGSDGLPIISHYDADSGDLRVTHGRTY